MSTADDGHPAVEAGSVAAGAQLVEAGSQLDEERVAAEHAAKAGHGDAAVHELVRIVSRALACDPPAAERAARSARRIARGRGPAVRAAALHAEAKVLLIRRRPKAALARLQQTARLYRSIGDRPAEATVKLAQIAAYALADRPTAALACARAARRRFLQLNDLVGLAKVDVNIGNLRHRLDQPRRAIEPYQRALATFRDRDDRQQAAMVALNLANVWTLLSEYDHAESLYREALSDLLAAGSVAQAALVDYNLSYLLYLKGQYRAALAGLAHAAERFAGLGDPTHLALCRLDRAEVMLELGLLQEATNEASAARASFVDLGLDYEAARALTFLALAKADCGEAEDALVELARARQEFQATGNRHWVAIVDGERARLSLEAGDAPAAMRLAAPASRTLGRAGLWLKQSRSLATLALAEAQCGRPANARRRLRRALRTQSGGDIAVVGAQIALGEILAAEGADPVAVREFDRAIAVLERMHQSVPLDSWEASLARTRSRAYSGVIVSCLRLAEAGDSDAARRAFEYGERARARSFLSRWLNRQAGATESPDWARLTAVRDRISWRRLASVRGVPHQPPGWSRRQQQLRREADALDHQARELGARLPAIADELDRLLPTTASIVQQLPQDTAFIQYFVSNQRSAALVLDRDGLRHCRIDATREQLHELLRRLQFQMNRFALGSDFARRHRQQMLAATRDCLLRLGALLIAPVLDICTARRWLLAPHDILHYVPFHALEHGDRALIDDREVTTVPSATALLRCLSRPPASPTGTPTTGSLVIGVPSPATPGIELEAATVAGVLPAPRVLLGDAASWDNLRRLAPGCRFIHLSTHGRYRGDSPLASTLRLQDRWLSFHDIDRLRLDAELVVLSACHAGLDRLLSGDELQGLGRALLAAGAGAVVTTLWAVEDKTTAEWMADFYRNTLASGRTAQAHRLATLNARERQPHPYYWAPYVLSGRPQLATIAGQTEN